MKYSVVQTFRHLNYDRRGKKDVYTDWYESYEDANLVFNDLVNDAENHDLDESEEWLVSVAICNEEGKTNCMWIDRREVRPRGAKYTL